MIGVYAGIFGAKALGAGQPLMAGVTLLSVGCGYWCLSRRAARGDCECCCEGAGSPLVIESEKPAANRSA